MKYTVNGEVAELQAGILRNDATGHVLVLVSKTGRVAIPISEILNYVNVAEKAKLEKANEKEVTLD